MEQLLGAVWYLPDWRVAVPANLLVAIQKNGGIVLGSFDRERIIGFVFSFIGSEEHNGKMKLTNCSHMLAVLPKYHSRKIGARLKFAPRDAVLAQGVDLITRTYDPLQSFNANLNLVRLGPIARRYIPDTYGQMTDGINAGIASDRFQVEWRLNASRVRERATHQPPSKDWEHLVRSGAQEIFAITLDARGITRIEKENELRAETLIAEIPASSNAIKTAAPDLAQEWRMLTRDFFTRAFASGYIATDFVFTPRAERKQATYGLTRQPVETGSRQ